MVFVGFLGLFVLGEFVWVFFNIKLETKKKKKSYPQFHFMPWLFLGINIINFVLLGHYNICFMTLSEIVNLKVKCDSYPTKILWS